MFGELLSRIILSRRLTGTPKRHGKDQRYEPEWANQRLAARALFVRMQNQVNHALNGYGSGFGPG
jgi:hypothetical protein